MLSVQLHVGFFKAIEFYFYQEYVILEALEINAPLNSQTTTKELEQNPTWSSACPDIRTEILEFQQLTVR